MDTDETAFCARGQARELARAGTAASGPSRPHAAARVTGAISPSSAAASATSRLPSSPFARLIGSVRICSFAAARVDGSAASSAVALAGYVASLEPRPASHVTYVVWVRVLSAEDAGYRCDVCVARE